MRIITTKSTAIAAIAYPAPWVNLVASTTSSTMPDIAAPTPLMTRLRIMRARTCGLRSRRQVARPVPHHARSGDSVNETKTPTM